MMYNQKLYYYITLQKKPTLKKAGFKKSIFMISKKIKPDSHEQDLVNTI